MIARAASLAFFLAAGLAARAAETAETPPPELAHVDTAVVALDGRPLFRVRGMSGYSAATRAEAIADRIARAAADLSISTSAITLVEHADRSDVLAAGTPLVSVLEADAAVESLSRRYLAARAHLNIIDAVIRYRRDRRPAVLLRHGLAAGAATLILALVMFALRRLSRRALTAAERHVKVHMENLAVRSSQVIASKPLWSVLVGALDLVYVALMIGAAYFYLYMVLGFFPWTRALGLGLLSILFDPLSVLGGKIIDAVPGLAFLAVLAVAVYYLLKVLQLFFHNIEVGNIAFKDFESEWAAPTYRIVRLLVLCFALVVAYPYIPGSRSEAFKGVSLFVGILFSLGSTSFIANIIASIALTYRRAFRLGDMIKVNDVAGLVTDMRLQATHLRTRYNEEVVIPNATLVNSHITNYSALSKTRGLLISGKVGIGYEVPWRRVESILLEAAARTTGLRPDQKPFVFKGDLGNFAVEYELLVFCEDPQKMWLTGSLLRQNMLDVFAEQGVQIMTPAYESDPEQPKLPPVPAGP